MRSASARPSSQAPAITATRCTPSAANTRRSSPGNARCAARRRPGAAASQVASTRGSKLDRVRVAQPISSSSAAVTAQLRAMSLASTRRLAVFGFVPGKVSEKTIRARIRVAPSNGAPKAAAHSSSAQMVAAGSISACASAAGEIW